jgi:hypothetical protein
MFLNSMSVNAVDVPGIVVRLCLKLAPGVHAVAAIS